MRSVAVAELRQNLSRYLKEVQAGGELLVTDRGQPVAWIIPVRGTHAEDAHRRRLIQAGVLRPRSRDLSADFWTRIKPQDPEGAILKALLEEREGGR